ncbi:MAG TPA: hypothetical protein VFA18_02855, partial [Gemmataceae bacterium]|nr:hypothetical protein [Gemmataceae bacterium]
TAWTLGKPHDVRIEATVANGEATGVLGDGQAFRPRRLGDKLVLEVTALPRYVSLDGTHP